MSWVSQYLKSSIGGKHLMGVTAIVLVLFVIQHMIGNLLVFAGPNALNAYAAGLKDLGPLLWIARAGLLAFALAHIVRGLMLWQGNRRARPVNYVRYKPIRSKLYNRSVAATGILLLAFIVYHLLHFTFGVTNPDHFHRLDPLARHDVYSMVVLGFQSPIVSAVYIVAMLFLAMHLAHGASSFFQSLGWKHPKYNGLLERLGPAIGLVVFAGNVAMPIAVLAGVIDLPGGGT
jgi:succinate dehydrogenase / fumarate reductase, cytochrome b subunit